jgi:hypothetical protein
MVQVDLPSRSPDTGLAQPRDLNQGHGVQVAEEAGPGELGPTPCSRSVVDEPLTMAFQVAQEGPTHRLRTAQGEAD